MVDEAVLALADSTIAAKSSQQLFADAIRAGAAAIHLEPSGTKAQIRYRVDGLLHETGRLSHRALSTLIAHLKHRANLHPDEKRWPQEGRFSIQLGDNSNYSVSVTTLPLEAGEKAVLKITKTKNNTPDLTSLGIWGETQNNLRSLLARHHGLVIVSGSNSDHLTTTIRSMARLLDHPTKSLMSVGTSNHRLPRVHHLHAHHSKRVTIADSLKAATNADSNVVLASELHGRKEVNLALDSANKGQLIIGGLHAPSIAHSVNYLQAMSNENYLLAGSLSGILHTQTVRKLCDNCKVPAQPSAQTLRMLTGNSKVTLGTLQKFIAQNQKRQTKQTKIALFSANKRGCKNCRYIGFKGQIGLYELLMNNERSQSQLSGQANAISILHSAVKNGMMPITVDGFVKALCGITTLEEVIHVRPRSK